MGRTGGFAMSAAVPLREDFSTDDLRRLAKVSRDAGQSRRLLALGRDLRWRQPLGGHPDRRGGPADGAGLGAGLQRRRSGRPDRRQGAGTSAQAER